MKAVIAASKRKQQGQQSTIATTYLPCSGRKCLNAATSKSTMVDIFLTKLQKLLKMGMRVLKKVSSERN
jgi:hypothetical protein